VSINLAPFVLIWVEVIDKLMMMMKKTLFANSRRLVSLSTAFVVFQRELATAPKRKSPRQRVTIVRRTTAFDAAAVRCSQSVAGTVSTSRFLSLQRFSDEDNGHRRTTAQFYVE
jgi:hypothetical protein